MTNTIKISAAGSGKTYDICHNALDVVAEGGKRVLIVTYTNRGKNAVETEIRMQNRGVLHPQVVVKTWFHFLLSETVKPYQRYITGDGSFNVLKGVDFMEPYGNVNFHKKGTRARYLTGTGNVRSNYVSELACLLNEKSNGKIVGRLTEIYSNIYFDEVQDLAGYDIELLKLLLDSDISITCCGDNKQATFSTHNAKKNKYQTGKNIWQFFLGLDNVDIERKLASRRFNQEICCFANMLFPIGDPITTIMDEKTDHDGVYLIDKSDVDAYYKRFQPQILRFDAKTKIEKYRVVNFGACKGETFDRILIYSNGPLTKFVMNGIALNAPEKYYVAVTRPRFSIAIALETLPETLSGYEEVTLNCVDEQIRSLKYMAGN
jgi:hypothetical protein